MSRFIWEQQHNIIKIIVPCLNPIINKKGYFDLYTSRTYVKFHLKSPKMFMDFDLLHDIDPGNSLNKVIATDKGLELVFAKFISGQHWEELLNPDKESSKSRREESAAEVTAATERSREAAEKKRIEMDRLSVSEQMRIDGEKRKTLEDKLLEEKNKTIKELFSEKPNREIFKDRTDIPETRSSFKQNLNFTAKRDPNLPARESTANEPPIPNPLRPLDGPAHESHPLFLKDKGDDFFKNGDFASAINAYTKALKVDPKFWQIQMNLASSYLKNYSFDKALEVLGQIEVDDERVKAIIGIRKGAIYVWKGMLADGLAEYRKANEFLQEESVTQDIISIEKRRESNLFKLEGDKFYKQNNLSQAIESYKKSLDVDFENEITHTNLAQIYLKIGQTQECVIHCDLALKYITHNQILKVKTLLRKAKATEDIQFVDQALLIDSLNVEAKALHAEFLEKYHFEQYDSLKAQADEMLKTAKASDALAMYKKLLASSKEDEQKIALLTNISACYLLNKDHQSVVSTVQRVFKLNPKPSVRLRLLCRRAKAYAALGQVYSAQCDLKEALAFDPDNEIIKKDLALLANSS